MVLTAIKVIEVMGVNENVYAPESLDKITQITPVFRCSVAYQEV